MTESAAIAVPLGEHEGGGVHALDLLRIALVGAAVGWARFGSFGNDAVALLATLAGGFPIFKEAYENLRARRMTMELSMTIALAAALSIGEFFTALVIVFFVLVVEAIEDLTLARGRRAIKDLVDMLPRTVRVRRDGEVREVAASEVRPGEHVLLRQHRPGGARAPLWLSALPCRRSARQTVQARSHRWAAAVARRSTGGIHHRRP